MSEIDHVKVGEQPAYTGNGVAIWKNLDKNGKVYLTIRVLNSITVNAFKNEPKPEPVVVPRIKEEDI